MKYDIGLCPFVHGIEVCPCGYGIGLKPSRYDIGLCPFIYGIELYPCVYHIGLCPCEI